MESVWSKTESLKEYGELNGNASCDVLVIGGGIAGIMCAYALKEAGADCLLVEAKRLCSGVTKNTTAKLTVQHGLVYDRLIREYGVRRAGLYLDAQLEAFRKMKKLSESVDCDYRESDAYVYSLRDIKRIENEAWALNSLGLSCEVCDSTELPFKVSGATRVKNQGQFHPLKLLKHLTEGLRIYENTRVLEIRDGYAITDKGKIKAKKQIVATHFPFINKHGMYFLKMYQHRSYVIAYKNAEVISGMYVDESKQGLSFRSYKGLLLLGGGGHRTGKTGGGWDELAAIKEHYYPEATEVARWATQDCMTLDGIPYVGRYSESTPDLFVSTGFNKWGMTSSMVSAMLLTELVQGREPEYSSVFSPSRSILHPQLALNGVEAAMGLLNIFAPRCPHLGCALKYNKQEHSWDCSCHGSRFTEEGEVIDNPANGDLPR